MCLAQGTWVKATDVASRQPWEDSAQLFRYFRHWESLFLYLPTKDTPALPSFRLPATPVPSVPLERG